VRVVFDTNIYVSAFAIPGGQAEAALLKAVAGEARLVVSRAIIHELLDVLTRKFGHDPEELAHIAVFLAELADVVRPRRKLGVLRDDANNRILECALAGRAAVIVTGDRAMLELGEYQGVRIVTLREFLEVRPREP
jgi:putative PIN family toxin of toxin-antitoxin system